MVNSGVKRLMESYPQIYFACHRRHVRDDESGKVLSTNQAGILDHLSLSREITVSDLAGHLGVTQSTVSTTLNRLQRFGYVIRKRDQADRRKVSLRLTAAGARLVEANSVLDPERVSELLALVPREQLQGASDGIEALGLVLIGLIVQGAWIGAAGFAGGRLGCGSVCVSVRVLSVR